jgi:hypothetical protein
MWSLTRNSGLRGPSFGVRARARDVHRPQLRDLRWTSIDLVAAALPPRLRVREHHAATGTLIQAGRPQMAGRIPCDHAAVVGGATRAAGIDREDSTHRMVIYTVVCRRGPDCTHARPRPLRGKRRGQAGCRSGSSFVAPTGGRIPSRPGERQAVGAACGPSPNTDPCHRQSTRIGPMLLDTFWTPPRRKDLEFPLSH